MLFPRCGQRFKRHAYDRGTWVGQDDDIALRQTVRHALEAGATKQHITETIGQMSVFAGVPAMTRALELAQQVLDEKEGEA